MSAHKFWDSDLRREPSLLTVAIEYARDYCGDFEFLVNAQRVVQDTGSLPLSTARAVLNCMRVDPNADVPPKPRTDALTRHEVDNVVPIDRDVPERYEGLSIAARPRREKKVVARYAVRIKKPYGVASMNGKVIHRAAPEAQAHWHRRMLGDWTYSETLEFDYLRVTWLCGRDTKDPILFGEEGFFLGNKPEGREVHSLPYCKGGCFAKWCKHCGYKTQLDNDDPPGTVIVACDNCAEVL